MVPLSMTLSDLGPGFQGHDIFDIEYLKDDTIRAIVTTLLNINRKSHALYRTVTFPMTFSDP